MVGDFNLDFNIFDTLNLTMVDCNMIQAVNFPTWLHTIVGFDKESTLDDFLQTILRALKTFTK